MVKKLHSKEIIWRGNKIMRELHGQELLHGEGTT